MKKKSVISLGPGAPSLILVFVVLALCMLGMLSLMNSRNDASLSRRSAEVVQKTYELEAKAEYTRAQIDETLQELKAQAADDSEYAMLIAKWVMGMPDITFIPGENAISWTETDELRTLQCSLKVMPLESDVREVWLDHTLISNAAEEFEDEVMFD